MSTEKCRQCTETGRVHLRFTQEVCEGEYPVYFMEDDDEPIMWEPCGCECTESGWRKMRDFANRVAP